MFQLSSFYCIKKKILEVPSRSSFKGFFQMFQRGTVGVKGLLRGSANLVSRLELAGIRLILLGLRACSEAQQTW